MTGWRVGYIAAPENFIEEVNKIHQYSALCAPTVSQYAAIEACRGSISDVKKMKASYERRARFFTDQMNKVGLTTIMPEGGLYCFSSLKSLNMSSLSFATALLDYSKVAVVPAMFLGNLVKGI